MAWLWVWALWTTRFSKRTRLVWACGKSRASLVDSDFLLVCLQVETQPSGAGRRSLSASQCSSGAKRMNGGPQSAPGSPLESHWSKTKGALPPHIPQQGLTPPASPRSTCAGVGMYTFLDAGSAVIMYNAGANSALLQ